MIFCHSSEKKVQSVYLFLAVGLIIMNFIVVELMQSILGKEEQLRESTLRNQKIESQFTHYRDMQAVYERQGRKMHDYKNQKFYAAREQGISMIFMVSDMSGLRLSQLCTFP